MTPVRGVLLGSSDEPLATAYDCAMVDLDGVVYVGEHAVEGVPELLSKAREHGMAIAFVTNNAARTPEAVAAHLVALGVQAEAADVVTSAQAAAREVAARVEPGARVLVVGGEGLRAALAEHGLVAVSSAQDRPHAVVQGFHPAISWALLAEGGYAVRAGAVWIASNLDLTIPTQHGIAPGNGTLVNAVATAAGRRPDVVAGKPFRPLFDETVRRIASTRPLVVGDRLDTDIEGAVTCGADSLLVMTGVTGVAELCRADPRRRPTYVSWTMSGLLQAHRAPQPTDGAWSLGGWTARVNEGGRLEVVDRATSDDDGLPVVAAACWTWLDAQDDEDPYRRLDLSGLDGVWSGPHR
jgi:HAD superfamily hydrolase (TIGR01450 family)